MRRWTKGDKTWLLQSVAAHTLWRGPVLQAHVKPYDADHWDTHRDHDVWAGGIYALNSWEKTAYAAHAYRADAVGIVDLWGRVVCFTEGFRAEWCMVRALAIRRSRSTVARELEQHYQCDVACVPIRDLGDAVVQKVLEDLVS